MSLSKYINVLENRMTQAYPIQMEEEELLISSEEVVKTTKPVRRRNSKKNPNPKFYKYLMQCLEEGQFKWMLYYVPKSNKKEFIVVSTDRKNKKSWNKCDTALFKAVDNYLGNVFKRKRSLAKYEEDVKTRFKSNLHKCVVARFVEKLDEQKKPGGKTLRRYKILWNPPIYDFGEDSNGNGKNDKNMFSGKKNTMVASSSRVQQKPNKTNKEKRTIRRRCSGAEEQKLPEMDMQSQMIDSSDNFKGNLKNQNISLKGIHEIAHFASVAQEQNNEMHYENVYQKNNYGSFNFCEEARSTLQYNYHARNSQVEIDEVHIDSEVVLENLKALNLDYDVEIDKVHVNSEVILTNLETPAVEYEKPNVIDQNMYLKIGNYMCSFTNASNQTLPIINCIDENLDFQISDQNAETNMFDGNLNGFASSGYDNSLNEGNERFERELDGKILKSDPMLYNIPEGSQEFSDSLGSCNDWHGTYQELQQMDCEQFLSSLL